MSSSSSHKIEIRRESQHLNEPIKSNLSTSMSANGINNPVNATTTSSTGLEVTDAEKEKKIINEFVYLLDKSRQLFNGLRDLPQYGHKNSQWQAYFGRTFDVYTKLWKFQQQNRHTLDLKYGLKRWQIGEIASKIGQLYYHYYLRTSESNYLNESFSFYQAIQTRAYYSKVNKEEKPDLMVKKLRFYARFIVVCLLLKKNKQVRELIKELARQIDDYVKIYDPEDQLEWQLVKNEINDFIEADSVLTVDGDNSKHSLSNRLNALDVPMICANPQLYYLNEQAQQNSPTGDTKTPAHLTLQEIIIVGNCIDQIKFSELSLDMFRILQAVEREPSSAVASELNNKFQNSINETKSNKNENDKEKPESSTVQAIIQRENPHKYLLYKPTFSQFYTYLSSAFKDLPPHSVILIYLSADGLDSHSKPHLENAYEFGGVKTNVKKDLNTLSTSMNGLSLSTMGNNQTDSLHRHKSSHFKDVHCIYPGDLYPYLRKPMFLIVDSFNSNAFRNIPNLFGQPFLSLLSPNNLPNIFLERQNQHGSIFTLFMTNPLQAFCYICNISNLNSDIFTHAKEQIRTIFVEIAKTIHKSKQLDPVFMQYSQDDFMRVFILRFVFCYCSLRLHRGFKGPDYYPSSQPSLSNDVIESRHLHKLVLDLALILNIRQLFLDIVED